MATLVLVNGPPASGKSTIADALVASRPLALDLDRLARSPSTPTRRSATRSRWAT